MTALLRVDQVSKAYGGLKALTDCSLEVEEGTIAGLIGPNGSGKTTLFNVITGYDKPDSGEVYLRDERITGAAPYRIFTAGLGRTFQLTRIFPRMTVLENMLIAAQHVRLAEQESGEQAPASGKARAPGRFRNPLASGGGPAERRRGMELLEFTGISRHAGALAGTLSYGQRKLLELAYILVASPAIVLLDEPCGGVNPTLINDIAVRIKDLNASGTTFLIVEHNMDFVMGLCDQVTVLDYGTVVASGPPSVVRDNPRVLDAYLGSAEDDDDDA